jgi:hypothetical protein
VAEGATSTFEVPVLEVVEGSADPVHGAPVSSGSHEAGDAPPAPAPPRDVAPVEASSGPSGLVIGLGVGGLVLVGAGSVLAVMAMGKDSESEDHCDPDAPNQCKREGVDLRDDARLFGNLATVGFAVGGAALASAVVLWIVGDGGGGGADDALALRVGPTGISVRGEL